MHRPTVAIAVALAVAAALTGCTAHTVVAAPDTSTAKTSAAASAPTPSASGTATDDRPAAAPSATSAPSESAASALAQHVYRECSTGAAAAGVRLTFTAEPSGYTTADGHYQLVYPFTFLDGHTDPYAVYNCALSDDTITSTYLSSGMSDSH